MTKDFNMKNMEYARELARKYNEAMKIAGDCDAKLGELGLDYTTKRLIHENPDLEFVEIKSCSVSYLTDKPVNASYMMATKCTPQASCPRVSRTIAWGWRDG